ncbi:MAG: putative endonuclease [Sphingomonadales bacterium]|jgi:putative endonuclease|nr:putative endonuclease [Sphingomonadales bacterium]
MPNLRDEGGMRDGWVYIMTDAPYGTLYIGVTANLPARIMQHRQGKGSKFCRKYGLHRLVYCEPYERIDDAIAREKAMKAWQRRWKTKLIEQANPEWADLSEHLLQASF